MGLLVQVTTAVLLTNECPVIHFYSFIHLLYSTNPSLGTNTTGCGTCQNSKYCVAKHNKFTLSLSELVQ
jgi:hypothetical protein